MLLWSWLKFVLFWICCVTLWLLGSWARVGPLRTSGRLFVFFICCIYIAHIYDLCLSWCWVGIRKIFLCYTVGRSNWWTSSKLGEKLILNNAINLNTPWSTHSAQIWNWNFTAPRKSRERRALNNEPFKTRLRPLSVSPVACKSVYWPEKNSETQN